MPKVKDFLIELSKSLEDIELARKISGLEDKKIQESYLETLQKKHGLGHTWFTSTYGGQLIIYISDKLYGNPTIEVTAKEYTELAKFLQKKGLKTDFHGLRIHDGKFDEEKDTIRIGIPCSDSLHYDILFKPKEGGILEIDYALLRNPLTYDIAEYIATNLVEKKRSILCCAR